MRKRGLGIGLVALATLALPIHSAYAASAAPSGINGFGDPGGFTLNGNSGGPDNQSAATHGVPTLSGGVLHLTTTQGVQDTFMSGDNTYDTFYGSENTSAYYNTPQYIGQFYASFVYHYNGSNPQSFGPGNGFTFILQNDPRGLQALGGTGAGNGQQGDGGTISPSATVEFGLFTGFGQNRGTQLTFNGDPGIGGTFQDPSPVKLVGANAAGNEYTASDPISVILSYDGLTLTESLTDLISGATFRTRYTTNLPVAVGSSFAYVGFTGGTGAAVSDQTITNFVFSNTVPSMPVNIGPKLTVTASISPADSNGRRVLMVTTTNTGLAGADMFELTSVTLGGASPMAGSPSPIPTTKNLILAPNSSQKNSFYYTPLLGTTSLPLAVRGDYTDPNTGMQSFITAQIRAVRLP